MYKIRYKFKEEPASGHSVSPTHSPDITRGKKANKGADKSIRTLRNKIKKEQNEPSSKPFETVDLSAGECDLPPPTPSTETQDEESRLFDCNSKDLFNLLLQDSECFQNSCKNDDDNPEFLKKTVPVKVEIQSGSQVTVSHSSLDADKAYYRLIFNEKRDYDLKAKILQTNRESVNVTLHILGTVILAAAEEMEKSSTGKTLAIDANKLLQSTFLQTIPSSIWYYGPAFPVSLQESTLNFWAQIKEDAADEDSWLKLSSGSHLYYNDARSLQPNTQISTLILDELANDIYRLSANRLCGYTPSITQSLFQGETSYKKQYGKPAKKRAKNSDDFAEPAAKLKTENPHADFTVFPFIIENHYIVVVFTIENGAIKVYDSLQTEGTPVTNPKVLKILKKVVTFLGLAYDSYDGNEDICEHLVYTQEAGLPIQSEWDVTNCGVYCLLFLEYLAQSTFWSRYIAVRPLPTEIKKYTVMGPRKTGFFKQDYVPRPKRLNPANDRRFTKNRTLAALSQPSTPLQIPNLNLDEIRKQYFSRLLSLGTVVAN